MAGDPIAFSIEDGVARILFDDPDNRNATTTRFAAEFMRATREAAGDPSVRVILLAGRGDFFSPGGDIREFLADEARIAGHVAALASDIHAGIRTLVHASVPVVVGLNGMAAGGGVGMMLAGDFIVAKRSARINSGYTRSGLTPDAGLSWLLPRLVGHARAFEIVALNEMIPADTARNLGILNRVVDDESFEEELEMIVQRFAAMAPGVLGATKRLLRGAATASLEAHLEAEAASIAARVRTPETRAILDAFLKPRR